jgi:hypothetical protein
MLHSESSFALLPPKRLPTTSSSTTIKHSETYDLSPVSVPSSNVRMRRNTEQIDGQLLRREAERLGNREHEDYTIIVHRVERNSASRHDLLKPTPPPL